MEYGTEGRQARPVQIVIKRKNNTFVTGILSKYQKCTGLLSAKGGIFQRF